METLLDSETLKKYEEETNEYINKKNIEKLFDIIAKNVLINKPDNVYLYIYNNIYSFLLNKIFIIGPPSLKITSTISSAIATSFDYYHFNASDLVNSYISNNENDTQSNQILINDNIICSTVKNHITSLDAKQKRGYVVEDFPKTNLQANSCLQYLPSHVFILIADEEYIYEKYEEENNIKIILDSNNQVYDEQSNLFEIKEIDTHPFKEKVKEYLRSIPGVLEVIGNNKKVINLRDVDEKNVVDQIMSMVAKNNDEWDSVFSDDISDKDKE
ncbi:adenylate kinase-like protein 2, putative [Plasmodium vinckei vinckei]|uniref:Adenylate kinase-like protein 2, putative n=1 Tax=Plasmodium vinckei vinckei TaxID=54757 RepID=A0A449BRV4_PLAVN|nr:adenylate kinase-like protein 2, putative [Plasmodium vinckei vinckei]VEV56142.1 adenylate kinase-like protein 2, putative [Plasmodium vinckei vinckei]